MKNYVICLLFIFFLSCEKEKIVTENIEPNMYIYAELSNIKHFYEDLVYNYGYIDVNYFPPVTQTEFLIDGLIVFEDDYSGMVGRYWLYDEVWNSYLEEEDSYDWITGKDYELIVRASYEDSFEARATIQVPGDFTINENFIPEELDTNETLELNWSNSENATNYRLYFSVRNYSYEKIIDSTIIIDPELNFYQFPKKLINQPNANELYIRLEAINGPPVNPGSVGNINGDGIGYFYGSYQPRIIMINYNANLATSKPNNYNQTIQEDVKISFLKLFDNNF